jgi:hypothetical protein
VVCQVLEAPESADERLVPEAALRQGRDAAARAVPRDEPAASRDAEIRLTYRELTELIADAVRTLKD